ncbi:MAG: 4-alpha-glucanotransferase [Candidatus Binatia bacterium]
MPSTDSIPSFPRAAGVAVPLFSLRGPDDVGTGEILDLIPFVDWLQRWRQRVVQLLPINETAPGEASPYNALSAFAIDPSYISVARVPEIEQSIAAQEWLQSWDARQRTDRARRATHRQRRAAYAFKLRVLELGFEELVRHPASERAQRCEDFHRSNVWWLDDYALFRALKELQRWTSWETWPDALRRRDPDALRHARVALQSRRRFFAYVQWIAAEQWQAVRAHAHARAVWLKGDLSFVCSRDSADVWAHQELFDLSSSAGAPPDAFSESGQAWGLPLYNWAALRRTAYEWWRQRARQGRTLYDVFRIDHVVGLYRTYAIPVHDGGTAGFVPADEAEQLTQGRDLLSAVLEEAGDTKVIAEDLGTVPDWVRASLTRLGIPGYKVFRWERHGEEYIDPRSYPPLSVTTTGTHDTDTLVAWWDGLSAEERANVLRSLDRQHSALSTQHPGLPWTPALHLGLLRPLYDAGSALTILPIQDLFGWRERINTPATTDRSNWTYRLPVPTEQLDDDAAIRERMVAIRTMIEQSGRGGAITG